MTLPTGSLLAASPATGDRTELVATMKKFADEFGSLLATNGWQKLPSGLIIQWGLTGTGGTVTTVFPIAFPTACFSVVATANGTTGGADEVELSTVTAVQFIANHANSGVNSSGNSRWIAIGY
jgi:hypothetical protein